MFGDVYMRLDTMDGRLNNMNQRLDATIQRLDNTNEKIDRTIESMYKKFKKNDDKFYQLLHEIHNHEKRLQKSSSHKRSFIFHSRIKGCNVY